MTTSAPTLPAIGDLAAGRYRIVRELGRGGYGVVYLARQEAINRDVAIKFLLPEVASDPNEVERFRREVFHASGLDHPHTITLYDYGRSPAGLFYVVMEYLDGLSLRDWLTKHKKMQPPDARVLLEQVLGSLEEAHGRQIVHRDLKPENIFVGAFPEGPLHTRVLDFGLSKFIGDPRSTLYRGPSLTAEGEVCGTPQYMSPEHAYGEPVGPPGDIYSLGLVLYEVLVGEPAFDGPSPLDILLKQVKEPLPALPKDLADTAIGRFIAKATEKESKDRFQDAGEALQWLLRFPPENTATSTLPPEATRSLFAAQADANGDGPDTAILPPQAAPTLDEPPTVEVSLDPPASGSDSALEHFELRLAQTPLIGRRRTLARLDAWLSGAVSSGGLFAMTGDAGQGKGAVLEAWSTQVEAHQRLQILRGSYPRNSAPLSGLRAAFSQLLQPVAPAGRATSVLNTTQVNTLIELFDHTQLKMQEEQGLSNVVARIIDTLDMLATEEPVLLILEDLHNSDPLSRRFIDNLVDSLIERPRPIALLVTSRQMGQVRRWDRGQNSPFVHWALPPLNDVDARALLKRLLPASETLTAGILKLASGNPALLLHVCRYLLDSNRLHLDAARDVWELNDPSTPIEELVPLDLQQLIIRRADRYLSQSENESALRSILHRAVLLGDEFDSALLIGCLKKENLPELAALAPELLEELTASGLLREDEGGFRARYVFARPLHRASLVRMVESIDDWRVFHELVARTIIQRSSEEGTPLPDAAIADHLDRAGKSGEALSWWLRAARQAENEHNYRQALQMLRRAEVPIKDRRDVDAEMAGTLRLQQGRLFRKVGEFGPAEDALREAVAHARRSENTALKARSIEALADVILLEGRLDETERLLEEVNDLYHVLTDIAGKRRVRLARAGLAIFRGHYNEARQLFRAIQSDAVSAGDSGSEIASLIGLARCDFAGGQLLQAEAHVEAALERARLTDDHRSAATALIEGAHVALFTRGIEAAESMAHQALTLARREYDVLTEANAHLVLGVALRRSTNLDRAGFHARRARELHESLGHIYGLLKSVLLHAELYWIHGDFERAVSLAEDTCRLHENLGDRHGWTLSALYQSLFLLELGRPKEARTLLKEILDSKSRGGLGLYEPQCLLYLAMAFEREANIEEAFAAYGEGQSIAARMGHRELVSMNTMGLVKLHFVMGDIEAARRELPTALQEAEHLGHAYANMFSLLGAALLARIDGDPARLRHFLTRLRTYLVTPNAPDMRLPDHLRALQLLIDKAPPTPNRRKIAEAARDLRTALKEDNV